MPTLEARAAFNKAQRLAFKLHDAHAQEHEITRSLKVAIDPMTRDALEVHFLRVCGEWTRLHCEYREAFADYTAAVGVAEGLRLSATL